jgi:hypothetical protein
MNKTYRHRPLAIDEYLGRVDKDGKVFETRLGPDRLIGRVDLSNGLIYERRFGPHKRLGRVDGTNGKVYKSRFGPDEYLGRVDKNGKCYLHVRLGRDEYLGRVHDMTSLLHGGAAFLLLILPHMQEVDEKEEATARKIDEDQLDAGSETVKP